jgi:hypothetical protein
MSDWQQYFSQLSNDELQKRFLLLLNTPEPEGGFAQAKLAVEIVAIKEELERRGFTFRGPGNEPS